MLNYNEIIRFGNTTEDTKKAIKKGTISDDMYYNKKIHDILDKLAKFKKYNRVTFKTGVKYMRKFFKTIHILEKDDILHYNQYFENAFMYLKTAINNFQSITISLPERDYIDALKNGDYETTKKGNELGTLCKQLYKECYYILVNISLRLNKQWEKKPMIFNKEITLNSDRVTEHNKDDNYHWSLY